MTKQYEIFNQEAAEKAVSDAVNQRVISCGSCKYWEPFPASSIAPEYHNCKRHAGVLFGMRAHDWCSLFAFREDLI